MSDIEKKPDGTLSEPNGRSFGKYQIINDDEMPGLDDMRKHAGGPASDSEEPAQQSDRSRPERTSAGSGKSSDADGRREVQGRREALKKRRGGGQKGSCPSWLKSRVYKGGRPAKDDKGLGELQELIIRHSPVGTAVFDNRGRLRIRNESFMDLMGLDSDDPAEDIGGVAEGIEEVNLSDKFWDAVETGSKVEIEEDVRIGGAKHALHMEFRPVSLPSGMSWCICYVNHVAEGSAAVGAIQEYKDYVAHLAASSGDAIVGLDTAGKIKYWNQGAQALFGYTDDEVVGRSVTILVPEELRREAQLVLKVVQEKGIYRNFDTRRITKLGERIPVTMTISAVRDDDGNLVGTAATCKDLREAKDLHEKAMEAEKLNAVLQMAVSVYHQVNNPLCVIAANAQLLLPRLAAGSQEEVKKLEIILDATKRISSVLDDLTRLTGVEPETDSNVEEEEPAA